MIGDGWDWSRFKGSAEALKYNRRDVDTIARVLPRCTGRTAVIQAGGNLGIYAKALAAEFRTVYTFEPDASTFAALCHNAPEPNVIKLQAALGSMRAPVSLIRGRRRGSGPVHEGLTYVDPLAAGTIPTLTIDDLALPLCELLWLDIEGLELDALRGGERTIERCRPVIVVESNAHLRTYGASPELLGEYLRSRNYKLVDAFHSDCVYCSEEVRC